MTATTSIDALKEMEIASEYVWVLKIIHSCTTSDHILVATRLASLFESKTARYSLRAAKLYKGLLDDAIKIKCKLYDLNYSF